MANVTVSVKGGIIATTTNLNGEFSIAVQKLPVYLVFSAVGYETRELLLNKTDSSKYISVSLAPATAAILTLVLSFTRITMMIILPAICSLEGMCRL